MKRTKSIYQADWQGLSLAKIDQRMAAMPVAGVIDTLNWKAQYPAAPETVFALAHTDEMLYVRFEVKGEVPLATKTEDLQAVNEDACVEMFIGNADNTRYWNFEFNPAGVCNASHRKERMWCALMQSNCTASSVGLCNSALLIGHYWWRYLSP